MWQVSVLLANADKPLPANVIDTVKPGRTESMNLSPDEREA